MCLCESWVTSIPETEGTPVILKNGWLRLVTLWLLSKHRFRKVTKRQERHGSAQSEEG
jgi:hypothetical protein